LSALKTSIALSAGHPLCAATVPVSSTNAFRTNAFASPPTALATASAPFFLPVLEDPNSRHRKIDPPPSPKKHPPSWNEIHDEISGVVRHQLLRAMAEKFLPGREPSQQPQAHREKKAT
jgi:hypothetical protein